MRAVVMAGPGALPMVSDVPEPQPGPGELLVRVKASSLNACDRVVAAGHGERASDDPVPQVLGRDFAGTVEALGEGAHQFAVGDEVFGLVTGRAGIGSLAEFVTVSGALGVAHRPQALSLSQAGALGTAGLAAIASIEAIQPREGSVVLISGASGGVGSFAIQLAAARGLHVCATARAGAAADFVRELGACEVVDYVVGVWLPVRALHVGGVDAVLHFAGDADVLADLVRPRGRFVSTLGIGPRELAGRVLTAVAVTIDPTEAALDELAALVAQGRLRVPITRVCSLYEAAEALRGSCGTIGKTAVAPI